MDDSRGAGPDVAPAARPDMPATVPAGHPAGTPAPATAPPSPAPAPAPQPTVREAAEAAALATLDGGRIPVPHADAGLIRILWVFAALGADGAEADACLLARTLDPARYRIEALPCFRRQGMAARGAARLRAAGVRVDTSAYTLDFEATVALLRRRLPGADVVIAAQNVPDIYPALEGMACRPPLIEHGRHVAEALAGPRYLAARFVGTSGAVRAAAADRMPGRAGDAAEIPAMAEVDAPDPALREAARARLGAGPGTVLVGWAGPAGSGAPQEEFARAAEMAAALVADRAPQVRVVMVPCVGRAVGVDADAPRPCAGATGACRCDGRGG